MILVDMEMPNSCRECIFREEIDREKESIQRPDEGQYYWKCIINRKLNITQEELQSPLIYRHEECPLIEIEVKERKLPLRSCSDCKKEKHCKGCMKPYYKHYCDSFEKKITLQKESVF